MISLKLFEPIIPLLLGTYLSLCKFENEMEIMVQIIIKWLTGWACLGA